MNFDEFGEDAFFSKDCIFLPNFSEQNVAREREEKNKSNLRKKLSNLETFSISQRCPKLIFT